jgi:hypothetical protein
LGAGLSIAGALREHPLAVEFGRTVERVHHRYAAEVVGAHRLCPFMREPAIAFGRFCVMMDRELVLDTALGEVQAAGSEIVHLVYPLLDVDVTTFERFGNRLHLEVAKRGSEAPVHATFHPLMEGDAKTPARLVGMLRRAPDPFIQFVPEGLHKGGTTYLDADDFDFSRFVERHPTPTESTHQRLTASHLEAITASLRDIRADRDGSYAKYLDAIR